MIKLVKLQHSTVYFKTACLSRGNPLQSVKMSKAARRDEPSFRLAGRLQAILEIVILWLLLPVSLAFTYWKIKSAKWAQTGAAKKENREDGDRLTVLVTGAKMAKALVVARCLWRQGHKVIMAETPKYWCSGKEINKIKLKAPGQKIL